MKTRTIGLTAQELARYLGSRVQILVGGTNAQSRTAKLVAVDIVNDEVKIRYEGSQIEHEVTPDSVRLILRKLITISVEEARDCFQLAYALSPDFELTVIRGNDYIELFCEPVTLIITTQGILVSSKDSGYRVGPAQVNARAALNYLNAQGFDLEGLIDTGFSVEDDTFNAQRDF